MLWWYRFAVGKQGRVSQSLAGAMAFVSTWFGLNPSHAGWVAIWFRPNWTSSFAYLLQSFVGDRHFAWRGDGLLIVMALNSRGGMRGGTSKKRVTRGFEVFVETVYLSLWSLSTTERNPIKCDCRISRFERLYARMMSTRAILSGCLSGLWAVEWNGGGELFSSGLRARCR